MKLATYKDGSRDGQLVVVSRDLAWAHYATDCAHTLQQVLDDWNFISPQLQDLSVALNQGRARHPFPFDPAQCMAPLPRAHQWVQGAAYASFGGLQREAEGLRPRKLSDGPDLMQLAADDLQGPRDPLLLPRGDGSLDFEVGLAVALAEVPRGAPPARALEAVRLLMVSVQAVWRDMEQRERAAGLGMVQSRVASHFSPVAATPDELGDAWSQGRVALSLQTSWNGRHVGLCDVAEAMTLHFGQLASQLAQTRRVRPATLLGTGPISAGGQMHDGERQWPKGWHSIAEKRAMETVQSGSPVTGYLKAGDQVQVDMKGRDGRSMLGAIELSVADADES